MNEKSPLDWARLAVAAATIKASEVTRMPNSVETDLPVISIGDTLVYQDYWSNESTGESGTLWIVGDCDYDTFAEALAEGVSEEVRRRVEEALGTAGLAT